MFEEPRTPTRDQAKSEVQSSSDEQPLDEQPEDEESPELNEELYDSLMISISDTWGLFDIEVGRIGLEEFSQVMVNVAKHQGLYEGPPEKVEQATIFFTADNLDNIFTQI